MSLTGPPPRLTRCPGLMSPAGSLSFPHIASAPRSSGKAQKRRRASHRTAPESPTRHPRASGAPDSRAQPTAARHSSACPGWNHPLLRVPHAALSAPKAPEPNASRAPGRAPETLLHRRDARLGSLRAPELLSPGTVTTGVPAPFTRPGAPKRKLGPEPRERKRPPP